MISAILLPVASILSVLVFRLVESGTKSNIRPGLVKERLAPDVLGGAGVCVHACGHEVSDSTRAGDGRAVGLATP